MSIRVNGFLASCERCGCIYTARSAKARYCDESCQHKHRRTARIAEGVERTCVICGSLYKPQWRGQQCCGSDCRYRQAGETKHKAHQLTMPPELKGWYRRGKTYRQTAARYGVAYEAIDRTEIFERDDWRCHICGVEVDRYAVPIDPMYPTLDHVTPLSKGGSHTKANVRCCHKSCNERKGNRGNYDD